MLCSSTILPRCRRKPREVTHSYPVSFSVNCDSALSSSNFPHVVLIRSILSLSSATEPIIRIGLQNHELQTAIYLQTLNSFILGLISR